MSNHMKMDANENAFFNRQLEHIKAKTYDTKYKNLKAVGLIPVSNEAPAGADFITFRSFTAVGMAKIIADYAKDFPRVDVYGTEQSVKIRSIGDSYGYSIKEIRRAAMAGTNLDQKRAQFARRAIDELVDSIAWNGDSNSGLNGLINYPGITSATIPNDGTGSSKTWATKTPDQIVRDVTAMINAVWIPTNGREVPDTILLPMAQYNLIATKRMADGSDVTILKYLMSNLPYINTIEWLPELAGAGANGADRAIIYVRDAEHLTLEVPQPFEQFPAELEGMEYTIACHAETAGVVVYYPQSVAYADGI